ncbi:MAG: galactokinase [Faecalibacterium sp.]|jgi:galactokinase|nr:galactokinase [Faecalibacterium sp.]
MATSGELFRQFSCGGQDALLRRLYGTAPAQLARQRARYCHVLQRFEQYYGAGRQVRIFSAPGRLELGGNHTDHQNGIALAAAANLDIIAVAAPARGSLVRVKSYGFDKLDVVDLSEQAPQAQESTHSASLIRGIAGEIRRCGGTANGFDAYTASDVLRGSGLSSSAAFETCIATIWNALDNQGHFSPLDTARFAQYAENTFFGKPSGLLDPLSCTEGGVICVDFADPKAPRIRRGKLDLAKAGYCLCVTDTRGSHSELTGEFARIRTEMESVSRYFGADVLRQVPEETVRQNIVPLRKACGDRAVLRALHFYAESRRAEREYQCLLQGDFAGFLALVAESGHSAFEYNQNAYCIHTPDKQAIPLALAISQEVLRGRGVYRLQGGGFAGTIQAFLPQTLRENYCTAMDAVFGAGSCHAVTVRESGAQELLPEESLS